MVYVAERGNAGCNSNWNSLFVLDNADERDQKHVAERPLPERTNPTAVTELSVHRTL